jgi:Glutathione-dependent formaldehyde-activating enzyme
MRASSCSLLVSTAIRSANRPSVRRSRGKSVDRSRVGGGRGPVAPPVFKTGLAANIVAGGFDSLPPPPGSALASRGAISAFLWSLREGTMMTGQCFCGSVAFEFDRPVTDIELCHCSRCQRATGSPFAAQFRVRADKFRWLRGEELISFCDAPILREPLRIAGPSANFAVHPSPRSLDIRRYRYRLGWWIATFPHAQ